jgi:hypothetical protein
MDDKGNGVKDFVAGEALSSAFSLVLYLGAAILGAAGFSVWAALAGHNGPFIVLAGLAAFAVVPLAVAAFRRVVVSAAQRAAVRVVVLIVILASLTYFMNWIGGVVQENRDLKAGDRSAPATSVVPEDPEHTSLASDNATLRSENILLKSTVQRLESDLKEARSAREPINVQVQPPPSSAPSAEEKQRAAAIRLQLARFQSDGQDLLQECHSAPDAAALEARVLKWAQALVNYVLNNVGELEARQLNSSVQSGGSLYQMPPTVPQANRRAFDNIRFRLVRLDALIAQLAK